MRSEEVGVARPPSYPLSETLTHAGQRNWTVSLLSSSLPSCFFYFQLPLTVNPCFPFISFFSLFCFSFYLCFSRNSQEVQSRMLLCVCTLHSLFLHVSLRSSSNGSLNCYPVLLLHTPIQHKLLRSWCSNV